jgi:alkanesulfonate monooxygenase SsuD/methylene tetrahydromethanopterin reductase-like flavin-dependent oxidoreductase (luciferase family)
LPRAWKSDGSRCKPGEREVGGFIRTVLLLAAVDARTRRVRLGTEVLLPTLHQPVVLARLVATVDRIAGGRVIHSERLVG